MRKSASLAVTASLRDKANRLACAMRWDHLPGDTFSVPLSPSGSGEPTHFSCHALVTDEFLAMLSGAASGNMPKDVDFGAFDLTAEEVEHVASIMVSRISAENEWQKFLDENGLKVIREDV